MNITVNEYSIEPCAVIAGTRGSEGVSRLSFSFDGSWTGLAKKVVFVLPDGERIYKSCRADKVVIPREVMQTRGKSRCFVVGRKGHRKMVSLGCELLVLDTKGVAEEKNDAE